MSVWCMGGKSYVFRYSTGSETWPGKMEDIWRLKETEIRRIRWTCGISLSDGRTVGRIPQCRKVLININYWE